MQGLFLVKFFFYLPYFRFCVQSIQSRLEETALSDKTANCNSITSLYLYLYLSHSPKVSVSFPAAGVVYEHAGEWGRDHPSDAAVHPLQPIVRALLAHDRDHRALEHRERCAADYADEYSDLEVLHKSFLYFIQSKK